MRLNDIIIRETIAHLTVIHQANLRPFQRLLRLAVRPRIRASRAFCR
jgi:hypothetical protein